jgi:hypothetical protein
VVRVHFGWLCGCWLTANRQPPFSLVLCCSVGNHVVGAQPAARQAEQRGSSWPNVLQTQLALRDSADVCASHPACAMGWPVHCVTEQQRGFDLHLGCPYASQTCVLAHPLDGRMTAGTGSGSHAVPVPSHCKAVDCVCEPLDVTTSAHPWLWME